MNTCWLFEVNSILKLNNSKRMLLSKLDGFLQMKIAGDEIINSFSKEDQSPVYNGKSVKLANDFSEIYWRPQSLLSNISYDHVQTRTKFTQGALFQIFSDIMIEIVLRVMKKVIMGQ